MEHDEATNEVHRLASLMPRGAGVGLSTSMVRRDGHDDGPRIAREGDDKPDEEHDSSPDPVWDGVQC